jgi:hypothetical protein
MNPILKQTPVSKYDWQVKKEKRLLLTVARINNYQLTPFIRRVHKSKKEAQQNINL